MVIDAFLKTKAPKKHGIYFIRSSACRIGFFPKQNTRNNLSLKILDHLLSNFIRWWKLTVAMLYKNSIA